MQWKPTYVELGAGCQKAPQAVARHQERIDVFVLNTNNELLTKAWNGKDWEPSGLGFRNLGGCFGSKPAIVARDAERLDLFIIGKDGRLFHRALDNSIWKPAIGFRDLGGNFDVDTPPTAVLGRDGIHVFLVGGEQASGGAYHNCWDGVDKHTPWDFEQFFGWHCSAPISAIVRDIED
jgi:hypothetical protein